MPVSGSELLMEREVCVFIRTRLLNGGEMSFMMLEQACIVKNCQEFCEHQIPMCIHE